MLLTSLLKGTSAEAIVRGILALVGYTFLLVGSLALANELLVTSNRASLEAQLCTSSVDCNTSSTIMPVAESETTTEATSPTSTITEPTIAPTTTETTPNTVTVTQPTVRFYEVPTVTVIGRDTPIAITLVAAHNPKLYLVSPTHGTRTEVVHQRAVENRLYYTLPTAVANPGEYHVLVVVTAVDGSSIANFTSPRFVVPKPPTNETVVSSTTNTTGQTPITTVVPETVSNTVATTTSTTTVTTNPLILKARLGTASNTYQIWTEGGGVYNRVELYLRNTSSTGRTFLGLATKTTAGYVYWLDASTVPVGTYIVIAQAKRDGVIIDATETKITTTAPAPTITETTDREAEELIIKTNLTAEATVPTEPDVLSVRRDYTTTVLPTPTPTTPRPITATATTPTPAALPPADILPLQERAQELLFERKERLNELFIRQASAIQTGDATISKLADEALEAEIKTLGDGLDANTKAEIERAAKVEIDKIKEKIVVTENILKARTKDKSALDTDKDGISDYDELTIYKTNAKDSDTDRDGVLDSIEIVRGFNPNDATTEAVINFASPKELRYTNDTILKVENVVPVLSHTTETESPAVHSEIHGFALPNSFVTLYIYSTPTVVTLRTNSDGSFAYVFEKELEDGEHEVYVALTDNTGDIVVQSNSFSFVKTAQAFTYEDDSVTLFETAQVPAVAPETSQTFMITIIMSIVAMGLILILLGQMLRTRRSDELTL